MRAIEQLAPLKTLIPKKKTAVGWSNVNRLQQKRDAAYRRYKRKRDKFFLEQFLSLRVTADDLATLARTSYYHNRLTESLANGNVWKELKDLGLLSKPDENLNGLAPDELNQYFAGVSVSPQNSDGRCKDVLNTASLKGFKFKEVDLADVVLAVSHFSSQACGEDGIPQSIVTKDLRIIGKHLVGLFNSSLRWVFSGISGRKPA